MNLKGYLPVRYPQFSFRQVGDDERPDESDGKLSNTETFRWLETGSRLTQTVAQDGDRL